MTRESKHALIEKALFGRDLVCVPRVRVNGEWAEIPTWISAQRTPENPGGGTYAGEKPLNYSASLDLCACAEIKILMEPQRRARYIKLLGDLRPPNFMDGEVPAVSARAWMIMAPATARVDAMVALIRELEAK